MGYRFMCYPGGVRKAVTFSYDDGCRDDLRLEEIFNKYGMKGTFNLNSSRLARGEDLTVDDAKKFLAEGHEVAVHGKNHRANGIVGTAEGIKDVLECREELEEFFGRLIRGMAYPDTGITNFANGTSYNDVKSYLHQLGIVYARTLGGDNDLFLLPTDWYAWMPTAHHDNPEIFTYIDEFLSLDLETNYSALRHPRLLYIWGHAYEFSCNNNWEHIEKICESLGGREDVWYATNIEIYEYVNAYNSLIWSANGKKVYNPTLLDVWFIEENKRYLVPSGETIIKD